MPRPFHLSLLPNTGPSSPLTSVNQSAWSAKIYHVIFILVKMSFNNLIPMTLYTHNFPKYIQAHLFKYGWCVPATKINLFAKIASRKTALFLYVYFPLQNIAILWYLVVFYSLQLEINVLLSSFFLQTKLIYILLWKLFCMVITNQSIRSNSSSTIHSKWHLDFPVLMRVLIPAPHKTWKVNNCYTW